MTEPRVTGVSSVEFAVRDMETAAAFYTDVWALEPAAELGGARYFRGTGPDHHILVLHPSGDSGLVRVNMTAPDEAAVDTLHDRLAGLGLPFVGAPGPVGRPGGGYGFDFKDPEGRALSIVSGAAVHRDAADVGDRPRKISHCVLTTGDMEACVRFFTDGLGFVVSDRTRVLSFLRCNADHHSIALGDGHGSSLHHIAFEMPDLDSVMRGAGRLRDAGYPIEWGVGRHGPGNNVFAYFLGPEDFVIEYTAEVEQVDEGYPTGGPDDWGFPAGRSDRWGVTDPPSERMRAAHHRIGFVPAAAGRDWPGEVSTR